MAQFSESLKFGKVAEGLIAQWLRRRGWDTLPVYEIEEGKFQGPRLFGATHGAMIAPDLLIFKNGDVKWIEAKHKNSFTWHRKTGRFVTGIDQKHWLDYLLIAESTRLPVWLLFLQKDGRAKDTPDGKNAPTGLYGGEIKSLKLVINHQGSEWGPSGMVYWAEEKLTRIASLAEVVPAPSVCVRKMAVQ